MLGKRRNILLFFTDQQRADTIGALGNPVIQTPALDSLVREGVSFRNAYTPSPVCVPARLCLEYGVYPNRSGCNDNGVCAPLSGGLYRRLTDSGYMTCNIGKMHFAWDPYGAHGFSRRLSQEEFADSRDEYFRFLQRNSFDHVFDYHGVRSEMYYIPQVSQLPAWAHPTNWVGEQAVSFLREREDSQPFFLFCSFIHPHPPFAPPAPWNKLYRGGLPLPFVPECSRELITYHNLVQNRYKGIDSGVNGHLLEVLKAYYYACISFVDYQIGRVLEALREKGIYDDTDILFASDHGELLGDYHCLGKRSMLDAAAKIPLIIKGEGFAGGTVCDEPVSLTDIAPTVLSLAGIPYQPGEFDGADLRRERQRTVFSQFSCGDTGLYMAAEEGRKLILSHADAKRYYFTRFPEAQNEYDPSNPECIRLEAALRAYIEKDVAPQISADVEALKARYLDPRYGCIRQDHACTADRERILPSGYHNEIG